MISTQKDDPITNDDASNYNGAGIKEMLRKYAQKE
jgi:hypothetical protein